MRRVRIELQPRVRQEARQQVRVAREDHRIAVAVGDEDRLPDPRHPLEQRVFGMPQAQMASYWAWRVCQLVGSSRFAVPPKMRPAASWPAARLVSVGAKKTSRYPCGFGSRRADRGDHLGSPAPHARCTLRRG